MSIFGYTIIKATELDRLKAHIVVKVPVLSQEALSEVALNTNIKGHWGPGTCNHCGKHFTRLDRHFKHVGLRACPVCGNGYERLYSHIVRKHGDQP